MNYLIVWQEVPENVKMYLVDGLDAEETKKLVLCQGHYVGEEVDDPDVEDALSWLSKNLEGQDAIYDNTLDAEAIACIGQLDLKGEPLTIIVTGFLM